MDNLVRTDTVFGKRVNVVGNISADLVLESLGKVYIKSRNKALTLEELINSLVKEDPNTSTSKVKVVEGIENLDTSEFKDGTFVFDKLSNILYLYLDNDLLELINVAPEGEGYVKRSGDTMTGRLAIYVKNGPPLYVNSADLVENLNAQYLNGETADKFTRRHRDEKISGSWTFLKATTFDQGVRIYKDAVLHGSIGSPNFSSGFGGYGWRMDADTNTLTVDNLVVRKLMLVYELVVNKISATNGSLWVSNAGKVTDVCKLLIKPYSFFTNTSEYLLFCAGLKDDFIKLTTEITNESLEAEAFSTPSGDNIITKECWSKNTLRNAKFIFIKQKGGDYRGQYFDNSEATNYSIFPLFSEDFKFDVVFPMITRNRYQIFKANTERIKELKLYIREHQNYSLEVLLPYYNTLALYERETNLLDYISFILPYYKYFANGNYYLVTFDGDSLPVFKPGDILRCQKWTYGGIKYYDAVVCNLIGSKYIIQLAPSFLDLKTTISYNSSLEPTIIQDTDSNNENLYKSTSKYESGNSLIGQVEIDDSLVLTGNIWNGLRLSAVYITSTDDAAPYMDVLSDMNRPDYSVIYYVPIYRTTKLYKSLYNLKTFVGYNNLVEIPYTGDYYVLDVSIDNFTCEYVCFKHNDTTYLATGKTVPNIAGVQVLYYLNTIPDRCTVLGKELDNSYITLETTGKIKLESVDGSIILEELLDPLVVASTRNTKARLGKLDGIQDELFPMDKLPYGYGLYGLNVFLTGEFYLSNGLAVADIGKEAITFAVASSLAGNDAINLLRSDMTRADNLIKSSHYSKGTLRTAGMRIADDGYGNPGMVIWGNKILFATTDAEFNGLIQPTMLLANGKIQGKYLDVWEAQGTAEAIVNQSIFNIGDDVYASSGPVRVFRLKELNTTASGYVYYTDSNVTLYVRKFVINDNETKWILVNPDGYPTSSNDYGEYTSVSYPNFTYYDQSGSGHSYSEGYIPQDIETAFINDYTTPLKVWALQKDGKGNLGGSTLYWNPRGKVVVNGVLYGTEGNIGGLRLGLNALYTLAKDANDNIFNPLRISTSGYGIEGEILKVPYILLSSMNTENIIRDRVVLNSRGLFYLGINTEDNTLDWRDFMTCQVPAVLFSLTVIPIYIRDKDTWTLYARLSTSSSGMFQYAHINWGEGNYAINFDYMNGTLHSSWNNLRDWFIDLLYRGQIHFSVSGINAAESVNTNAGLYDFRVKDMYLDPTIQFRLIPRLCIKANISYMFFLGGSKSFGPSSHIDYSNAFDYAAQIDCTTDLSLWLDNNGNPEIDRGGLSVWDYSGNNPANYFKNVIVIDTSDDETVNWGGFNLTAIYLPTMDSRFIQRSDEKLDNYDPEKQEEINNVGLIKTRLINTYGTGGTAYVQALNALNNKENNMTSALLADQQSVITSIESSINSMASTADNISDSISLSEIQNLETSLLSQYASIMSIINNLETNEGGGEVTPVDPGEPIPTGYLTFDDLLSTFLTTITNNNLKNDNGGTLNSLSTDSVKGYLQTAYNMGQDEWLNNTSNLYNSDNFEQIVTFRSSTLSSNENLRTRSYNAMQSWLMAMCLAELIPNHNSATASGVDQTNNLTILFRKAYELGGGAQVPLYNNFHVREDVTLARCIAAIIYAKCRSTKTFTLMDAIRTALNGARINLTESWTTVAGLKYLNPGTNTANTLVGYLCNLNLVFPNSPGPRFASGFPESGESISSLTTEGGSSLFNSDGNYKVDKDIYDLVCANYNMNSSGSILDRTIQAIADCAVESKQMFFDLVKYKRLNVTIEGTSDYKIVEHVTDPNGLIRGVFNSSVLGVNLANKIPANYPLTKTTFDNFFYDLWHIGSSARYTLLRPHYGRRRPGQGDTDSSGKDGVYGFLGNWSVFGMLKTESINYTSDGYYYVDANLNGHYDSGEAVKWPLTYHSTGPANTYPSGHTSGMWTVGLILAQLYPNRASLILKAIYSYGVSRTIVRWHWNSDVLYGMLVATTFVPVLNATTSTSNTSIDFRLNLKNIAVNELGLANPV